MPKNERRKRKEMDYRTTKKAQEGMIGAENGAGRVDMQAMIV